MGKRKEKVSQRQADILDNCGDGIMEWNGGRHHHMVRRLRRPHEPKEIFLEGL